MRFIMGYLQRLLSLWWLVLLAVLTAGGTATLTGLLAPRSYTATARLVVRPAPGFPLNRDITLMIRDGSLLHVAGTVVETVSRPPALAQAAAQAGLSAATAAEYDVNVDVEADQQHVLIETIGPQPAEAAAYANSLARVADQMTARLYRVVSLQTIEAATVPNAPSRPDLERDLPLALGLGLVLGLLLAVFYDYLAH